MCCPCSFFGPSQVTNIHLKRACSQSKSLWFLINPFDFMICSEKYSKTSCKSSYNCKKPQTFAIWSNSFFSWEINFFHSNLLRKDRKWLFWYFLLRLLLLSCFINFILYSFSNKLRGSLTKFYFYERIMLFFHFN